MLPSTRPFWTPCSRPRTTTTRECCRCMYRGSTTNSLFLSRVFRNRDESQRTPRQQLVRLQMSGMDVSEWGMADHWTRWKRESSVFPNFYCSRREVQEASVEFLVARCRVLLDVLLWVHRCEADVFSALDWSPLLVAVEGFSEWCVRSFHTFHIFLRPCSTESEVSRRAPSQNVEGASSTPTKA